ncbi:hypothetical protein [Gracilinema caldarium]|uniref:Uncharacterized protein n=1 Tax=Gracilinema caldarium (strain ATCC 51460 / DSM 7334 / H1) TaxID=744872 RepID=F8F0R1_GRAC1|nr:hypothetical protein [Gracilinema caldarium]AEJ19768.1 hypothetical protein Spica_1625 [Gracilinema caldarium DSM 7334]
MEERKKQLMELKKKQESYEKRLVDLYKNLGHEVLAAASIPVKLFKDETADYNRLVREQDRLSEVLERLKTLLEKEQELKNAYKKQLNSIKVDERDLQLQYIALGVSVLSSSFVPESIFTLKQQYEALIHQLEESEDHIAVIDQEETKDFFSFIGKHTRKLTLKVSRSGKEREMKQVSQKAGQLLLEAGIGDFELPEEAASLMNLAKETLQRLQEKQTALASLSQSLDTLRRDIQQLCAENRPQRTLRSLEKQQQQMSRELDMLFERVGQKITLSKVEGLAQEAQDIVSEIHQLRDDLASIGRNIEILTTELQIDQLNKEIEKLQKTIRVHQERKEKEQAIITDAQHKMIELSDIIQRLQRVLE